MEIPMKCTCGKAMKYYDHVYYCPACGANFYLHINKASKEEG